MPFVAQYMPGLFLCLFLAVPAWLAGRLCPVVGGPVFAILGGMAAALLVRSNDAFRPRFQSGIAFTARKILQYAVILLGFGMNLSVVAQTGLQSLPIIMATIGVALLAAWLLYKRLGIPGNTAVLVGVGSAICGGSAIAATAPVIKADDSEIAQAISVVFLFNILAALIFPSLGALLGFSGVSGEAFGLFAGTAINDTSSVTAAAATWDALHGLGSSTLDKAVTVKLTRTLAIIPIVLVLAFYRTRSSDGGEPHVRIARIFPFFILWFAMASLATTLVAGWDVFQPFFSACKQVSRFFIIMAMAAIGLNTDIVKLARNGGSPLIMGLVCWLCITLVSLGMQYSMGIW